MVKNQSGLSLMQKVPLALIDKGLVAIFTIVFLFQPLL
jgi:hypothetical protein